MTHSCVRNCMSHIRKFFPEYLVVLLAMASKKYSVARRKHKIKLPLHLLVDFRWETLFHLNFSPCTYTLGRKTKLGITRNIHGISSTVLCASRWDISSSMISCQEYKSNWHSAWCLGIWRYSLNQLNIQSAPSLFTVINNLQCRMVDQF